LSKYEALPSFDFPTSDYFSSVSLVESGVMLTLLITYMGRNRSVA
jgi:hypothetical protein